MIKNKMIKQKPKRELDEKTILEVWKTLTIAGVISYSLELIALILLWTFGYFFAFWVLLIIVASSWFIWAIKISKLALKLGIY